MTVSFVKNISTFWTFGYTSCLRMKAIIVVCLLALAKADIDNDFCKSQSKNVQLPVPDPMMKFPTEFTVCIEKTEIDFSLLHLTHQDYSQAKQRMSIIEVYNGGFHKNSIYIDVKQNISLIEHEHEDGVNCTGEDLTKISYLPVKGILAMKGNETTIASAKSALQIDVGQPPAYIGQGTTRAGIPTQNWQTCMYNPTTEITSSIIYQFADKSITTPLVKGTLLSASIEYKRKDADHSHKSRLDYVNFLKLRIEDRDDLLPAPQSYCPGLMARSPVDLMPDDLSFRSEILDLGDPGRLYPDIYITYTRQEYVKHLGLFVYETLESVSADHQDATQTVVHEFNLGLSFHISNNNNSCDVREIPIEGIDTDLFATGKLTLEDPKAFFHLDHNYEYIGVRRLKDRGIDCDVWTYMPNPGEMYIWYFANANWMTGMGYDDKTEPFPVSLEHIAQDHKIMNFYEYATKPYATRPDYSACFSDEETKYMYMTANGGSFHDVYMGAANEFKEAMVMALAKVGKFNTTSRITNIDVRPLQSNSVIVFFTCLGKPTLDDPSILPKDYPSINDVVGNWKSNFKSLTFTVQDSKDSIRGIMVVDHIDFLPEDGTGDTGTSPAYKPTTHGHTHRHTDGSSPGATHGHTHGHTHRHSHGATQPYKVTTLPTSQKDLSHGSGFSSGSMAGLAIGVLVLGVLLGVGGMFAFKRWNLRRGAQPDAGFMELNDHN